MPATDSFTSTATATSSTTAVFSYGVKDFAGGSAQQSRHGFLVVCNREGVTVTKAPSLGGKQAALTFPLTRNDAHELANALLKAVN